ncbi:MAG: BMP family lipoprotein [Fusobacteriaceae bacterium]
MKKKVLTLMNLLGLFLLVFSNNISYAKKEKPLKIGIVLATGGLGDNSYNDSAFRGLQRAKKELGITFKYIEPSSPAEDEQFLREYADNNFDLVIATGFQMTTSAKKVASEFPNIKFVIIDDIIKENNVKSIVFKEEEGSFLVGTLAAMMTKSQSIAFIGGLKVPAIEKFGIGFSKGAKYINPDIIVSNIYIGGQNPFNDPVKGKEAGLSLIKQGTDVLFQAAGATGIGVIEASKETNTYMIGVDSNQDSLAPGLILTSMVKNVDVAIFETIKSLTEGKFVSGTHKFGIKESGVGVTDFKYTKEIIGKENMTKLEKIKTDIVSGALIIE